MYFVTDVPLTVRLQETQFCLISEYLILTELGTKTRYENTTHFRMFRKI